MITWIASARQVPGSLTEKMVTNEIIMATLQLVGDILVQDRVSLQNTQNTGSMLWKDQPLLLTAPKTKIGVSLGHP